MKPWRVYADLRRMEMGNLRFLIYGTSCPGMIGLLWHAGRIHESAKPDWID